jgi:Zn-finger nucleic acid-binding protein
MTARAVEESTIDVCENCGGVWLDWFDGEAPELARQAAPLPSIDVAPPPLSRQACPRCVAPLRHELFLGRGPGVFRCADCMGLFVPRASFDDLLEIEPTHADEPPPSEHPRGWPARMLARIRGLLGAS